MENQRAEDLTVGKVVKACSRTSGTDIDSVLASCAKPDEEDPAPEGCSEGEEGEEEGVKDDKSSLEI